MSSLPSPVHLLDQLDALDLPERHRTLAQLAHRHVDDPDLDGLLDGLQARDDLHSRRVALQVAIVAKRTDRLAQAVVSGSVLLGKLASSEFGRTADVGTIELLLPDLPPNSRLRMLSGIIVAKRVDVADRILPTIRKQFGDRDATKLLRGCSSDVVRAFLPVLRHSIPSWGRLAIRHDEIVLDDLRQRLESASPVGGERLAIWSQVDEALDILAIRHPRTIVELAGQTLANGSSLPPGIEKRLGKLSTRAPLEVGEILLHPEYRRQLLRNGMPESLVSRNTNRTNRLRLLPQKVHTDLAQVLIESPHHLAKMLQALPPSRRGDLFEQACKGIDTSQRRWPGALLVSLPHRVRSAEAKRIRELPAVRKSSRDVLSITAYCDIDSVQGELEEAARRSRAEERAEGCSLLIECTGRNRRGLTETLKFVVSRVKNDQDMVRQSVISALEGLPISLFTSDHVELVRKLIGDALAARDTTDFTHYTIQRLSCRLLEGSEIEPNEGLFRLGLDIARMTLKQTGSLSLPRLGGISQAKAVAIYAAIESTIAECDDSEMLTYSIAESLGERAWAIADLQSSLGEISGNGKDLASSAADLWLSDPKTRDERVRHLLDKDPSAIYLNPVKCHLLHRRQTLLDPYLDGRPVKGCFGPDNHSVLCAFPIHAGYEHWLPRQQKTFRQFLLSFASGSHPVSDQVRAVRILSILSITGVDDLNQFLQPSVEEISLVEAALTGLSWTDCPADALPILLDHLDGDRARVAMYALPRCASLIPPRKMLDALRGLLLRERLKITVHKEAIRLLGALGTMESMTVLVDAWKSGNTNTFHRDVRIAFCHAARKCLGREESWAILGAVAADKEVARSILDMKVTDCPGDAARRRYVELMLLVVDHSDAELRRSAFSILVRWINGSEEEIAKAAIGCIVNLEDGVAWRGALSALIATVRNGKSSDALLGLVQSLHSVKAPSTYQAGKEHYVVARRRLVEICNSLQGLAETDRARLRKLLRTVIEEVEQDGTLWESAARLRLATVDWTNSDTLIAVFSHLATAAEQVPWRIPQLTRMVGVALQQASSCWQPENAEVWLQAIDANDGSTSAVMRHVELIVVVSAARRAGWISPCVDRLRILRQHPDLGVRTAALDVHTGSV